MILGLLLILTALNGPSPPSILLGVWVGIMYGDQLRAFADKTWKKLNDKLDEWADV